MKKIFALLRLLLISIAYILGAFVLIHIFAVFGILIAIAYPLLWLFIPKKVFCLFCRAGKEGTRCPLCQRQIAKQTNVTPENLKSALLNGLVILIISLVSLGIVFAESRVLSFAGFGNQIRTAGFTIPAKGQYRIGEIFPMKITIENIKQPINAVQADVGFDPKTVELVDISTKDSFATIFIQKEINNEKGWARLTGGLPNPGFSGTQGIFGTIFFKAKAPGVTKINFLPSSLALTNDGKAVNVLKDLPSASYLILPETLSEEEKKEQTKLISNQNVLGASINNTQMTFYEDKEILAMQTEKEIQETKTQNTVFLQMLQKLDLLILNLWKIALNL